MIDRAGIAMSLLVAVSATAGAQPEQQQALIRQALDSAYGYGTCLVYVELRGWQQTEWPEGEAAVNAALVERILPRYTQDAAVLKRDPIELANEYANLCRQTQQQYFDFDGQLAENSADAPEVAQQKVNMRQTMSAARFVGQCQIASAIYFGTLETRKEDHEHLGRFMTAKIYSQDPKYLPYPKVDLGVSSPADVDRMVAESTANAEGQRAYWADCDAVTAKLQQVTQQLNGP